ncbi:MAG: hexokinase [Treponema sp.]|jgi:hexokinase|nr:hexokinase [Treponema sp.]
MKAFDPRVLADFARSYGFHYDICDPRTMVQDALLDMERGLAGKSSPMPMIPSYLRPITEVPLGKTVVALDAGGTNLRAARVSFREAGKPETTGLTKIPMPGTKGRVGAEEFFDRIAEITAPLLEGGGDIAGIGFCFSYPMRMKEDGDGLLISLSKEVDAPEVPGMVIGDSLKQALKRRGARVPERVVLLNDTVAALLSGLAEIRPDCGRIRGADTFGAPPGPVVGFILGTGFNTAYPEKFIPKINFNSPESPMIVVCESGTGAPRYLGILDREFDATTKNPGVFTMEKAAAGAYLGPLTFHILKRAIDEGVVRFRRSGEFAALPCLQTRELNEFMHSPLSRDGPIGSLFDRDELDSVRAFVYLVSIVTQRGAYLAAAVVAAAVERMDAGFDPFSPVRIAVEGTTYVMYRGVREALESALHIMLNREKPRSYFITPVEQASLFGAAVAGLSK